MQSKLLSSQFPSEIYSYKPPPQYLYFSSNKQWACSACTIFSLFASVHFSPCLQEINLWTFILAETAVELLFWRKTPASVKRGLQTRLISNLAKYCQHLPIKMLKIMLMWKKCNWCPLRSQMRTKLTAHSKTGFNVKGAALRRGKHRITSCECALGFETHSSNRLDEEIKPCYT